MLSSRLRREPVTISSPCDTSGLCDEVERLAQGGASYRLVGGENGVVTLVDVAPVTTGHLLVVPCDHAPNLASVAEERLAAVREAVRRLPARCPGLFGHGTVAVEHGSGREAAVGDCVRHAHLHVVPRGVSAPRVPNPMASVVPGLVEHMVRVPATSPLPDTQSGYVMVECMDVRWIGRCAPSVRHVARRILARLAGVPEDRADWMTSAWNADFHRTLAHLRE